MPRGESPTSRLAFWFVTQILKREWTDADYRGLHMKHAKNVLKELPAQDIVGSLLLIKNGVVEIDSEYVKAMTIIYSGEPSVLSIWLDVKKTPPHYFYEEDVREWEKRNHESQTISEWITSGVPLPETGVRDPEDPDPTGRSGQSEPMASGWVHKLHKGERVLGEGQDSEIGVFKPQGGDISVSGRHDERGDE